MARDGTSHGGARIGAGAKKKPLADKIAEENPGKRTLTVIDFENKTVDLEGQPIPKPSKMLSATQKDGKTPAVAKFYQATWEWLAKRKCASLVSPQLLERYSMSVARWTQCEEAITEFGFIAKHPTDYRKCDTVSLCGYEPELHESDQSPLDGNLSNRKRNCASEYSGDTLMDDAMERLLRARKEN